MEMQSGRVAPWVFRVPVEKIRNGYYSDKYFTRTQEILVKDDYKEIIEYQFFLRRDGVVCGIDEALAILKTCTGYYRDPKAAAELFSHLRSANQLLNKYSFMRDYQMVSSLQNDIVALQQRLSILWENTYETLKVQALHDGDEAKDMEPILAITGNPRWFIHLETVLLGVIARASALATATKAVVKAAGTKPVMFFPARFDHYLTQATDGYAAMKAGAFGVSTDSNADYWGSESLGTIPHIEIGCYKGDTALAAVKFNETIDASVNRIVLVDWDNDVIRTSLEVVEAFKQRYGKYPVGPGKDKVWGVRFDTSGTNVDKSVVPHGKESFGVCPELIHKARRAFDESGYPDLKVVVSGGFNEERIKMCERMGLPVDVYGVGASLFKERVDVTADICSMLIDGVMKPITKVGRKKGDWTRLKAVE